jgi:hypothetical protein
MEDRESNNSDQNEEPRQKKAKYRETGDFSLTVKELNTVCDYKHSASIFLD